MRVPEHVWWLERARGLITHGLRAGVQRLGNVRGGHRVALGASRGGAETMDNVRGGQARRVHDGLRQELHRHGAREQYPDRQHRQSTLVVDRA